MTDIEISILDFIQKYFRTAVGDVLMPFITKFGDAGLFWIAIGILLLVWKKHRKTGVLVLAALLVDVIICNLILKNAVARIRPFDVNPAVELLIAKPGDYSFPSGHTAASFAAVTALYLAKEKYWYLALILSIAIAFSRLYLYVHYPTDILGGLVVGIGSGILAYLILKKKLQLPEWKKLKNVNKN